MLMSHVFMSNANNFFSLVSTLYSFTYDLNVKHPRGWGDQIACLDSDPKKKIVPKLPNLLKTKVSVWDSRVKDSIDELMDGWMNEWMNGWIKEGFQVRSP
jgi:hypothetical protein